MRGSSSLENGAAPSPEQMRITALLEEIARARENATDAEGQIERARHAVAALQHQLDRARVNDADLRAQLERAGAAVAELEAQVAAARRDNADLRDQLDRARERGDHLLREVEAARVDRLHLLERLDRAGTTRSGPLHRLLGLDAAGSPVPPRIERARRRVARRFLRGRGLEIGALHTPMRVRRGVEVTYVDRLPTEELRREYAEWSGTSIVEVDVVDDGERLERFPDGSQDFVIASHMLEHCENPLGTMRSHLAKLGAGGRLMYVVPDRRGCFDAERPLTSFEHLVRDDREGPERSRWAHYLEFSRLANRSPEDQVESIAQRMMDAGASIHFHVWEDSTFREFLERASAYLGDAYSIEHLALNEVEIIAVLAKR